MIVPQGYPLWVAYDGLDGERKIEAVIAWRFGSEQHDPLPITTSGEIEVRENTRYTDQADVVAEVRNATRRSGQAEF